MKQAAVPLTVPAAQARRPATLEGCGCAPAAPRLSPACADGCACAAIVAAAGVRAAFCMPLGRPLAAGGACGVSRSRSPEAFPFALRRMRGAKACCKLNKAPPLA